MNEPPVITVPNVQPGEEVIHNLGRGLRIIVIADDPDSEALTCWWDVPGVREPNVQCLPGSATTDFSTVLTLDYDPDLDDELVVAHLYDADSQVEVSVAFRITVGGEI